MVLELKLTYADVCCVTQHADVVLELKLERGLDPKFYQQMAMQGVEMTKTGVSLAASGVQQVCSRMLT